MLTFPGSHRCFSQRLKTVLLQSVRENTEPQSTTPSQHSRKRAFADLEAIRPTADTHDGHEKRQKAVPAVDTGVDGLCKLRMALAQARTVLKAA